MTGAQLLDVLSRTPAELLALPVVYEEEGGLLDILTVAVRRDEDNPERGSLLEVTGWVSEAMATERIIVYRHPDPAP